MVQDWRTLDLAACFTALNELVAETVEAGEVPTDFSDRLHQGIEEAASCVATRLSEHASDAAQYQADHVAPFEARLRARWRPALNLYNACWNLAHEEGARFSSEHAAEAKQSKDLTFYALRLLHARACRTAREVLVLLQSGYGSGAFARWRTLHELAVVAQALGFHGTHEIAGRYLSHQIIHDERDARWQRKVSMNDVPPVADKDYEDLVEAKRNLVERYGEGYDTDYGWAVPLLGKRQPSFVDLETLVEQDGQGNAWRPMYKAASHPVHGGAKETVATQMRTRDGDRLLTGPTNIGLARPASSSLASLLLTTGAFLIGGHEAAPDPERAAMVSALHLLVGQASDAFDEIEGDIAEEERIAWGREGDDEEADWIEL